MHPKNHIGARRRNGSTRRRIINATDTGLVVQNLNPTTERVAVKKDTGKRRSTKRNDIVVTKQTKSDIVVRNLSDIIIIIGTNTVIEVEAGVDTSDRIRIKCSSCDGPVYNRNF